MRQQWKSTGWYQALLYFLATSVAIVVLLLPMGLSADSWFMPDLVLALTFAWVIRRPDAVPFYLIGMVGLLADILLDRPIGPWALLLMLGAEVLRMQSRVIREYPLLVEWLWVSGMFAAMLIAQRMLFFVTLVPNLPLGDLLQYFVTTIVCYPLVVVVLHWVLGVRARHPGRLHLGLRRTI